MIKIDDNFLMMIEPKSKKPEETINDDYSQMADFLLSKIERHQFYRGFHVCACGQRSDNAQCLIGNIETNSLLAHYVKNHRSEVPMNELIKLKAIYNKFKAHNKLK